MASGDLSIPALMEAMLVDVDWYEAEVTVKFEIPVIRDNELVTASRELLDMLDSLPMEHALANAVVPRRI